MTRSISLLGILTVLGTHLATAQINYGGGTYSENFDSILNTDGTGTIMTGVGPIGAQDTIPTLTTWRAARVAGSGTGTFALFCDWGSSGTGRLYSYGYPPPSPLQSERALGSVGSGTTVPGFGTWFINTSADTFEYLTFSFDREIWRTQSATADQSLAFAYGFSSSGTGITTANFLTDGSMIAYAALNATAPGTLGGSNVSRDGNADPYKAAVSATISGIRWAPGDTLFIRWNDKDDTGSDAGIAIDNLTMIATVPEPAGGLLLGLGFAALALLRRKTR